MLYDNKASDNKASEVTNLVLIGFCESTFVLLNLLTVFCEMPWCMQAIPCYPKVGGDPKTGVLSNLVLPMLTMAIDIQCCFPARGMHCGP